MMDLLKEHHLAELREVNNELAELSSQSLKLKKNEAFPDRDSALNLYMERFNRNLISNKNKKLEKDRKAFQYGKAYRWGSRSKKERASDQYATSSGTETDSSHSTSVYQCIELKRDQ